MNKLVACAVMSMIRGKGNRMGSEQLIQHWVLLGTAEASQTAFGLREIDFPCGYSMPYLSYTDESVCLNRPRSDEAFALAGFTLELNAGGKLISTEAAIDCVAGYRPWLCVFGHALLDELTERRHTITTWDEGVSIFYGLWRENCQSLGELIPADEFNSHLSKPLSLVCGDEQKDCLPSSYNLNAGQIIQFYSKFLTLNEGDRFVLGPLVAMPLPKAVGEISWAWNGITFSKTVS